MREARIDVGAIEHNVRAIRSHAGVDVIAVVKADGYGHGAVRAARAALAGGASRLGVADIAEALALRQAGIDAPVMAWLHAPDETFQEAVGAGIEIAVSRADQLRRVASLGSRAGVHLKLETGLGRNGVAPEQFGEIFREADALQRAGKIDVHSIFSHLSNTSEADDRQALDVFRAGSAQASDAGLGAAQRHIAASEATLLLPGATFDAVRIGVAMYGLSPTSDQTPLPVSLRPAMTLRAAVAATRRVAAGHGVSYGYLHRTARETTLALVPLGYADGIPRNASGQGVVRIGETTYPVAGRIAMDQFVVDLGDDPVSVGDDAVLFGDPADGNPPVEVWADSADTINYEIVTRIGARVPRTEVRG